MNKKLLAAVIASLVVLTSCIGIAQISQVSAYVPVSYKIEIKVTNMNLYADGDFIGKGEIYMNDPGNDWPSADYTRYTGGFHSIYFNDVWAGYEINTYDISSEGVSFITTSASPTHDYTYSLMDKDSGTDDQLWSGTVKISGTTNGWVSGWSGAKSSTNSLAGGNVKIYTSNTISETYKFTKSTGGTVYTWYQTFTNALRFEIRVTAI